MGGGSGDAEEICTREDWIKYGEVGGNRYVVLSPFLLGPSTTNVEGGWRIGAGEKGGERLGWDEMRWLGV